MTTTASYQQQQNLNFHKIRLFCPLFIDTNISMWRSFNARLVPIFIRRSFNCKSVNPFERVSKAACCTASKARLPKSYAVCKVALIVSVLLAASLSPVTAQSVSLGQAQNFAILGGSTVTNTGATLISGNVGVSPGSAITGFPPGRVTNGALHAADPGATQAHADAATAFTTLAGETATTNLTGQNLGGMKLNPGVYRFDTSAQLTGTLLLNTASDPNGTFIFQIGSTLTTASNSAVKLLGLSAGDPNIFWQVGSSATLGTGTMFDGNILAQASITMTTGANIALGRALAISGAVTLDTNSVNATGALLTGTFWNGSNSNLWSGVNWSPDATGAVLTTLGTPADVIFSVTGIQPKNENTDLDSNVTISSLTVNDPAAVTISGPHTLSIVDRGITINSGAGLTTINSNLQLGALSQAITVNNAAGLVINGVVDGTNGLIKAGAGQLMLTAAETYTGATLITAGTLQLGNGITAGSSIALSGPVTVDKGAVLALDLASGETFANAISASGLVATIASGENIVSGVISGTGALTQSGTGLTILTGANTYTGTTSVLQGTLQIGNDGTSGSFLGNVTDDAALVFDRSDNVTFAGTIAGTGSVAQSGSGKLILSAANTYGGGTNFNAGILSVASDGNLGGGPLTFNGGTLEATGSVTSSKTATLNTRGGTFLADAGTSSTLSGVISGPGSLTKDGLGEVILTGTNTYSGGTILSHGVLTVGGSQALGTGNMVVNGGILRSDRQPINVKGNYTQTAGGTLQLEVAGPNPGQYDTLTVGGNAALGGTLQLISLGFQPKAGNLLTLVSTGGVVSGQFAQFVDPFANAPGVDAVELLYQRKSVQLLFLGLGLDSGLTATVEGLTALYEISFSNANIQRLNLEDRLDDIRSGSNGFSSNMKVNGANVTRDEKATVDGKSSKNVVEPILQPGPENRWGVWVTGFGDFVSVDSDANAKGYNFTTGGVSLGIDYRIGDQFAIGAMGEYSHTWTSLNPSGHVDVDSGRGGMYATWFNHGIYLNGAIYGGYNTYDSSRAGFGGLANGSTEGAEWSTFIGGGYDFHFVQLTIGPIASLQYTDVHIDGFSEKSSLAPLDIHSDSAESLRSDVGFRLFYQWQIGKILVEPSLKAAWEHEYKYSALPITAGFAGIPGPSATFFGPSEGHDSAVVSAGVSVQLTPAIATYVNYDGQLGRGNYDSNAVTGGVRISF
jgi:outer membrane autotransporter protein